jgi:hypothetical protein
MTPDIFCLPRCRWNYRNDSYRNFAHGEDASLLHGGWNVFGHHMMALILVSVYTFFGRIFCLKSPIELFNARFQRIGDYGAGFVPT